jgi:hypothetical protein
MPPPHFALDLPPCNDKAGFIVAAVSQRQQADGRLLRLLSERGRDSTGK